MKISASPFPLRLFLANVIAIATLKTFNGPEVDSFLTLAQLSCNRCSDSGKVCWIAPISLKCSECIRSASTCSMSSDREYFRLVNAFVSLKERIEETEKKQARAALDFSNLSTDLAKLRQQRDLLSAGRANGLVLVSFLECPCIALYMFCHKTYFLFGTPPSGASERTSPCTSYSLHQSGYIYTLCICNFCTYIYLRSMFLATLAFLTFP